MSAPAVRLEMTDEYRKCLDKLEESVALKYIRHFGEVASRKCAFRSASLLEAADQSVAFSDHALKTACSEIKTDINILLVKGTV